MSAQERESKRNFIALLSDNTEEQCAVESPTKSDRLVGRSFLGLMAAVLNRARTPGNFSR
jgi:hypothetical protein